MKMVQIFIVLLLTIQSHNLLSSDGGDFPGAGEQKKETPRDSGSHYVPLADAGVADSEVDSAEAVRWARAGMVQISESDSRVLLEHVLKGQHKEAYFFIMEEIRDGQGSELLRANLRAQAAASRTHPARNSLEIMATTRKPTPWHTGLFEILVEAHMICFSEIPEKVQRACSGNQSFVDIIKRKVGECLQTVKKPQRSASVSPDEARSNKNGQQHTQSQAAPEVSLAQPVQAAVESAVRDGKEVSPKLSQVADALEGIPAQAKAESARKSVSAPSSTKKKVNAPTPAQAKSLNALLANASTPFQEQARILINGVDQENASCMLIGFDPSARNHGKITRPFTLLMNTEKPNDEQLATFGAFVEKVVACKLMEIEDIRAELRTYNRPLQLGVFNELFPPIEACQSDFLEVVVEEFDAGDEPDHLGADEARVRTPAGDLNEDEKEGDGKQSTARKKLVFESPAHKNDDVYGEEPPLSSDPDVQPGPLDGRPAEEIVGASRDLLVDRLPVAVESRHEWSDSDASSSSSDETGEEGIVVTDAAVEIDLGNAQQVSDDCDVITVKLDQSQEKSGDSVNPKHDDVKNENRAHDDVPKHDEAPKNDQVVLPQEKSSEATRVYNGQFADEGMQRQENEGVEPAKVPHIGLESPDEKIKEVDKPQQSMLSKILTWRNAFGVAFFGAALYVGNKYGLQPYRARIKEKHSGAVAS